MFRQKAQKSNIAHLFETVVPLESFADIPSKYNGKINVPTTIWAWISQVYDENGSCQAALSRIQTWLSEASDNKIQISSNTSAYCQSRKALPDEAIDIALDCSLDYVNKLLSTSKLWRGLQLKAIDGTSTKLSDTEANQEKYPQPEQQAEGCGFPVMGIGGVINLSTGCIEGLQFGAFTDHDLAHAHQLVDLFSENDLVLADRAYNSYGFVGQLLGKCAHSVMRLNQSRADRKNLWNRGKRLGENQRLVTWVKPAKKSECMTQDEWDQLPSTLEIRYIRVKAESRDQKMRYIYIATTLLDHEEYPITEICELYQKRWDIEVKFRDIKSTLGFDMCNAKTPEMAEKTMKIVMLAYNLIKCLQVASIKGSSILLDSVSFKQTVDLVKAQSPLFIGNKRRFKKKNSLRERLRKLIKKAILPKRKRPTEPRVTKTRLKYDLMTISRQKFRTLNIPLCRIS